MTPIARVKSRKTARKGRGFSEEEIKKAGLTIVEAKKLKVAIDTRRKTAYDTNINELKKLELPAKKAPKKKKAPKPKAPKAEKAAKPAAPKAKKKVKKVAKAKPRATKKAKEKPKKAAPKKTTKKKAAPKKK